MSMVDYKVDYTNHKLYHSGEKGRKQGSPIRIFTNVPLNRIHLPESEGYRLCRPCEQYRSIENIHCTVCKTCPSKNGSKYVHCNQCALCVKPSYRHCSQCNRCTQIQGHKCIDYQRNLTCWICRQKGHNEANCIKWFTWKKSKTSKKSVKLGAVKKRCFICAATGHNEKTCKRRAELLNEHTFMQTTVNVFSKQ